MLSKPTKTVLMGLFPLVYIADALAVVDVSANVSSDITFTDNVNLTKENKEENIVSTFSAGVSLQNEINNGNIFFSYNANQTQHSFDSNRNEFYNQLSFSANKSVHRNNLTLSSTASIDNVPRSIEENANADIISGDTIEARTINAAISYQSNPRKIVVMNHGINMGLTSNEDKIGDNLQLGLNSRFNNGTKTKHYFWTTNYSYNQSVAREDKTKNQNYTINQEIGLKPFKGFSPLITGYYEGYKQGDEDVINSGGYGPALRYYMHERSFVEIGYDYSIYDEDFWRGSLNLNPNPRISMVFDFTRRFYGDAYSYSLNHRSKKTTTTINYTEEKKSFERQFVFEGATISDIQLVKGLNINSNTVLRRGSISLNLNIRDRQALINSNKNKSKLFGSSLKLSHNLSKKTSVNGSFKFDKNIFKSENNIDNKDYYRLYNLSLKNQFSKKLSWSFNLSHTNSIGYQENRAGLNATLVL